jgi:hypothetical protein
MSDWESKVVSLRFQLSDWTLFSATLPLQMRAISLGDTTPPAEQLVPPATPLLRDSQGFAVRSLRIAKPLPAISISNGFLCYTQLQYWHYYIDLGIGYTAYLEKFSSKTRSTINRKVKKYAEQSGGIVWKAYSSLDEMEEFHRLAREVSQKTYQEKLLDAGIPADAEFVRRMKLLAAQDQVRAYILFDDARPVSYLYCPVENDVLIYAYLGYDPGYIKMSVGTVLQWLAMEALFKEARFSYFDFTEGQSDHKRLFATHELYCANVLFLRRSFKNRLLVRSHYLMGVFSQKLGNILDKYGVKAKVKRMLRFMR